MKKAIKSYDIKQDLNKRKEYVQSPRRSFQWLK